MQDLEAIPSDESEARQEEAEVMGSIAGLEANVRFKAAEAQVCVLATDLITASFKSGMYMYDFYQVLLPTTLQNLCLRFVMINGGRIAHTGC